MKKKSRSISFYLLKSNFTPKKALKDKCTLKRIKPSSLPSKTSLYLADTRENPPWWKDYLGIEQDLTQCLKGAILFIPLKERVMAVTFGNVHHNLKPESYEYDFGLMVTLNSIDPLKLKSTDILRPENALKSRIQTPQNSDISFFEFDQDSSIVKRIAGLVKSDCKIWFTNVSGADNVKVSTIKQLSDLPSLCEKLLERFNSKDYSNYFPELNNIKPIKDPSVIDKLDGLLVDALNHKNEEIIFTVPEIIDQNVESYKLGKTSESIEDIDISKLYEFVTKKGIDISVEFLKKQHLGSADSNGIAIKQYTIYRSLIWDCVYKNKQYHFNGGCWYLVDKDYLDELTKYLDKVFENKLLPNSSLGEKEEEYNKRISKLDTHFICLDKMNISPQGEKQVEPCDLYNISEKTACYFHVKRDTKSATLSHLFNQGLNSIELINVNDESKKKMIKLIKKNIKDNKLKKYIDPINEEKSKVVYVIITAKPFDMKSKILPLFSRITLKRTIQALTAQRVKCAVTIVNYSE